MGIKNVFFTAFETKAPLFSYDECRRRVRSESKLRLGWGADMQEWSVGLILTVQQWRQQSHQALKWLNHNEEKSFQNTNSTSRYLYYRKKNPYHIYWLCFHFPLGEPIVMRKEMKEDCFLPSALSTQLILLGGQISAVPGEEKQKMSLINQKQNDQWPVSAENNTPQLIIHLQMKADTRRMTSIHSDWAILDVCPWLHWEMEHAGLTREASLASL